jgi:hypothetical protein
LRREIFARSPIASPPVVAVALHARYAGRIGEPKRGALSAWTTNRDAYEHYLEGQALLRRRGTGVKESVKSFEAAIRLDPNFARAHARWRRHSRSSRVSTESRPTR